MHFFSFFYLAVELLKSDISALFDLLVFWYTALKPIQPPTKI